METKDLIVLGSGPGGYIAAIRAAQLRRSVTIIEKESLGGVCLNWGCIPTKALLNSAQLLSRLQLHGNEFGIYAENVRSDYRKIVERSRAVAAKLSQGVQFLMKKNNIEVVSGEGTFEGGNKLVVKNPNSETRTFAYKDIIIATGGRPKLLPGMEADGKYIHTSRTLLNYYEQPKEILVIGAGAIGIEFAYFLHALGTKVTVVEMLDQILPVEDTEVSRALETILKKQGMVIKTGSGVQNLRVENGRVRASIKQGDNEEQWEGDSCLIAVGVTPNTEGLGLEKAGVATERGFIKVDSLMKTGAPHHYAIGDVSGPPLLAHKASHEGLVAAEAASGVHTHGIDYQNIAGCTYCQPQVASVGLTEQQVKQKGIKYRTAKVPFAAIGKAIATGESEGFVKVIISEDIGEVLGVHILCAEATELISEASIIRSHEGIASSVVDTIHPHPTLSESIMEAMALAIGRPINVI